MTRLMRNYSTVMTLTPVYSMGFSVGLMMGIQIVTGLMLGIHYVAKEEEAFAQIHSILMRDMDGGWALRYIHANGAGVMMLVLYAHIVRACWYGSMRKSGVWNLGVTIFILVSGVCFTGYSLVLGQMSLFGVVVISSFVTVIPVVGVQILEMIWGGKVVGTDTLQRFFGIHFVLPLLSLALVLGHLLELHRVNSTGEVEMVLSRNDRMKFHPLLLVRDVLIVGMLLMGYLCMVCFDAERLGNVDQYVEADPMVTPKEIAPEYYFLWVYGIVRAIPNKRLGVLFMVLGLLGLYGLVTGYIRWLTNSGLMGGFVYIRSLLLVLLLDAVLCSMVCLMVNHEESMYWLLLATVMGLLTSELEGSMS